MLNLSDSPRSKVLLAYLEVGLAPYRPLDLSFRLRHSKPGREFQDWLKGCRDIFLWVEYFHDYDISK